MTGRLVVMGSGELAPRLVATHRAGIAASGATRVTILDTPFGFQENADELVARIRAFFATSLSLDAEVATLRHPDTTTSARALATVRASRYVFAGPGSPTYALGVWQQVGMGEALRAVVTSGGTVAFASAAALTLGSHTIPVYEVYKAGEQPHWRPGLDVFAVVGLGVPVVPHWNNAEGGTHDTSRCFIGRRRFEALMADVPTGALGVDEHTAATVDLGDDTLSVSGQGAVTLWSPAGEERVTSGESVPLDTVRRHLVGGSPAKAVVNPSPPTSGDLPTAGEATEADALLAWVLALEEAAATGDQDRPALRDAIVRLVELSVEGLTDPAERVGPFVELVLDTRRRLRSMGDYATADALRDGLVALGVEVRDGPEGTAWSLRH